MTCIATGLLGIFKLFFFPFHIVLLPYMFSSVGEGTICAPAWVFVLVCVYV